MSNILSNEELIELLPKISIGTDKPKTQVWLNQADALKIMRVVEAEVLRRLGKDIEKPSQTESEKYLGLRFNT